MKKRSDVLEKRFAEAQAEDYEGPEQLHDVLADIIPEYAELLEETRAIEVRGEELEKAHELLIDSLERQQAGLELALRGIEEDNRMKLARAGRELESAQTLVERHRRLLSEARRQAR